MKPLHTDAALLHQLFRQIRTLLEDKAWTAAGARLDELRQSSTIEPDSLEYGEFCILSARVAVALGDYKDAVRYGRDGLTISQLSSADDRLAEAHWILGEAYLGLGETRNARVHTRDALAIYRRLNDGVGMMRVCNDLARIHFVRGEYDLAVDQLTDAIDLSRKLDDPARETAFLGNLGRINLLQGHWVDAERELTEAWSRARAGGYQVSVARNLLSLGYLDILRHEFDAAAGFLDQSLTLIESEGLTRERSIHHEYSGWWHYEQRHWVQAKEAFRSALEIGRHLGAESDIVSQSLRGLAECEAALHDWTEAQRLAEEGVAVALDNGERVEIGSLYRLLAGVHAHKNEHDLAAMCLTKATEVLEAVGDPYELARLAVARAQVAGCLSGLNIDPIAALNEAADVYAQLGANNQISTIRWMQVDAHRAQGQMSEALAVARELLLHNGYVGADTDRAKTVLESLTQECVRHSLSSDNEFRLGRMPQVTDDADTEGDELQASVDFYRNRINASRALLIEVTVDGERSGRILAQSGASEDFAKRVGALAANTYQHDLPTDTPQFYWTLPGAPQLQAHLTDESGVAPASVLTVPVELGPAASGILYADVVRNGSEAEPEGFAPRDLDFAVAFAEIVAWRSTKLRSEGLLRDVHRLRDQLGSSSEFPSILTQDDRFRETLSRARMIVDADVSILLEGETGTGKDLLGRAIHYSGKRRDRRFVTVNCAALPESLLESELFGVRRGAFTGADRDKPGLFEEADGGTFFLDEIGEMPLSIQAKLLRLLETKEIVRLGDTKSRHVDVRVISATNRDLSVEMERGTFRRDLFYRLTPLVFTLPPLRDRREDIPLLIDHFLSSAAAEAGHRVRLSTEAVRALCAYHWPGNVRELDNEIRKITLLAEPDSTVSLERLSRKFTDRSSIDEADDAKPLPERFCLYDHVAQLERLYIARALNESRGVKKHAAARLGIPESTLRLKMKQYDI